MTDYKRKDGRTPLDLRTVRVTTQFTKWAEGSVLIEMGQTRVICTATIEDRVPPFLTASGDGRGAGSRASSCWLYSPA